MKNPVRKPSLILLALLLCMASSPSHRQTAENSPQSSENLNIVVSMWEGENGTRFLTDNLHLSLADSTYVPLNTSLPTSGDLLRSARFSVVSGQGVPYFWQFLRVSYNSTLSASEAESYADDVLGEFRKAFNLPMDVKEKTHVINNETATIDVYYKLSDIERKIEPFEELIKYCRADGFGQLVTTDLLSWYLRYDFIAGTTVHQCGIFSLEYNLNRVGQAFVLQFNLELLFQAQYQNGGYMDVNFGELLRCSGSIAVLTHGLSQARLDIWKREDTHKTPLWLSFNNSSLLFTNLKEDSDTITVTYDLTVPVDNIVVRINVAREIGFNLIYIAAIVVAVSAVSVAVFLFVRAHRRKFQKVESGSVSNSTLTYIISSFSQL